MTRNAEPTIKAEVRHLSSQNEDGSLMYPGPQLLVWMKPPHFPWLLVDLKPYKEAA